MTPLSAHETRISPNPSGGRILTAHHEHAETLAFAFEGLPAGIGHYGLIAPFDGPAGQARGWRPSLVKHLELLLRHTQPQDWGSGARPIVWLSVKEAARKLGLSTTQVRDNEQRMLTLGALAYRDSTNNRRFGRRDSRGQIKEACGLDLSPLAALSYELQRLERGIAAQTRALNALRRDRTLLRRRVRGRIEGALKSGDLTEAAAEPLLEALARLATTKPKTPIESLHQDIAALAAINTSLDTQPAAAQPVDNTAHDPENTAKTVATAPVNRCRGNGTPMPLLQRGKNEFNKENTTVIDNPVLNDGRQEKTGAPASTAQRPSTGRPPAPESQPHTAPPAIAFDTLLEILPEPVSMWLAPGERVGWEALVRAAGLACHPLGISAHAWDEARRLLGPETAATALILIAAKHGDGRIDRPGGYLRALTHRALTGELHLERSIYGLKHAPLTH